MSKYKWRKGLCQRLLEGPEAVHTTGENHYNIYVSFDGVVLVRENMEISSRKNVVSFEEKLLTFMNILVYQPLF